MPHSTDPAQPAPAPYLRVTRGNPDAAEVAALTAVLLARGARPGAAAPRRERALARWSRAETGFAGAGTWWRREDRNR
ncbi:acyl-CoA carboxylase subunit epsilon [Streptomyces sp. HNM0574]|uniref:acyl-CoA carboxylase subunit epsilon n=1 Tax=Streptomyces sp. HNM0574 TaxID=2714954 RepID=UPI00146E4552|nr:acyl-CoA carboxylase subunit epsilon [Streptomyces sp. HNM0574]NLU68556.1 acyl-CoA carboxylase subunit epsilon [Streptomyces sp. HNM0574]